MMQTEFKARILASAKEYGRMKISRVQFLWLWWAILVEHPYLMGFFSIVTAKYFGSKTRFPESWLLNFKPVGRWGGPIKAMRLYP